MTESLHVGPQHIRTERSGRQYGLMEHGRGRPARIPFQEARVRNPIFY